MNRSISHDKRFVLILSMLSPVGLSTTVTAMAQQQFFSSKQQLATSQETAYTKDLATTIDALFEGVVKLILDFVDDNNQESYSAHVQKFAQKIAQIKAEVLTPIDAQITTASGSFRDALIVAKDIVQDLINNIDTLHSVLVKHLPHKNAINLKSDLEPVIQRITSTETIKAFDNKLVSLYTALVNAGHQETAKMVVLVRAQLQQAKASFDAQKVSPKMLAVLRNRLRHK